MYTLINKLKITLGLVGGALILSAPAHAQQFSVIPKFPKENDTVTFIYDARKTPLKDAQQMRGLMTGYQNFKWTQDNLDFTKQDTVWTADYVIPTGMALINFVFKANDIQDNGGEPTYSYILSTNDNKQVSGGMLGWGLLRTPQIVKGVPYVVDSDSYKTDEILLMWVKYELQQHPENRFKVLYAAASALKHMNTASSLEKLNNELNVLQQIPELKEEDLLQVWKVYKEILQDSAKAAELEAQIRSRFPEGQYVRDQQRLADFKKFAEAKDDAIRLQAAKDFLDRHPFNETEAAFNDANRISYISVYWSLSVYTSMYKDLTSYTKYIATLAPYEALSNVIYRTIDVPYISQKSMNAQEILPYAQVVMDRLKYYRDNFPGDKYSSLYYANAALFAKILVDNKRFAEAFEYASAAQRTQKYERADLNDTYVRALEGLGKKKEMLQALETSYRLNQSSTYMLDLMKAIYIANKGSETGYAAYLSGLKDASKREELKAKVQKLLISKDAPAFQLKDQFGNTVSLAQQKGKVVILDFWASWCAPCKAAFPGMKLAVDHFKNDPNVVFYFVDTQEKRADAKEYVTNYMKENNYPFTVLLDSDSKVSKSFGVGAIPHKIVVGPNGKMRFSEVGYMGSASELADEIIEMVRVLKEGK